MKKILLFCMMICLLAFAGTVSAEYQSEQIPVTPGDPWIPVQIEEGGSIGQTFVAVEPFDFVALYAPTWSETTSGFTFELRADGPGGSLIHSESVENAVDGMSSFTFASQPAGTYYIEMNEPVNQIGWWTKEGNVYADGTAYLNGEAVSDQDRVLILRLYGEPPAAAALEEPAEAAQPNPQTADAGSAMYAWLAVAALLILTAAVWMRRSRTN